MTLEGPPRQSYEPADATPEIGSEPGGGVWVLAATPASRVDEWAERVAVAIATQWSEAGHHVLLADLALASPRLHALVGRENREGITDVLLYGASLERVTRTARQGFLFASAGTPVADGAEVLTGTRWDSLRDDFGDTGGRLVGFFPLDEPGIQGVLSWSDQVVVLAGHEEANPLEGIGDVGCPLGRGDCQHRRRHLDVGVHVGGLHPLVGVER
jgi:hypothetical protein